ncbi:MAG: aminotransferase class IV [Chitinophagia bacterium]|jgi:branched-chain amino acid aminotransferase
MQSAHLLLDGKKYATGLPLIDPDNRTFRYGDGFFETLKLVKGHIPLFPLHTQRLQETLELLKMQWPPHLDANKLYQQILQLAEFNGHLSNSRIRLTFFRDSGGLYDEESSTPHWLIQTWKGPELRTHIQTNGLDIGIYPTARKSTDIFSSLKTAQFLPYAIAARWARENQFNDALVLNTHNRIADSTISNIFIVKNNQIFTPPISEGVINGVLRKYLINQLQNDNYAIIEQPVTPEALYAADEIFLTNVISGIRWVKQLENHAYTGMLASKLYSDYIVPLWFTDEKQIY